jgi:histone H3/H4
MVQKKHALPIAAMERLLKDAGADRVGEDAKAALRDALEAHAIVLGRKAVDLAKHARRATVRAEDVRLAEKSG